MSKLLFFVPDQASSVSSSVDLFFFFMVAVSGFFSVLIAALILYFAIYYREGGPAAEKIRAETLQTSGGTHGHGKGAIVLEIVWTAIPFVLVMVMFVWSTRLYFTLVRPPADAMQLYAVGKQWMWKFQHLEGVREINELHVPVGQNVRLTMSSEDVIHSFFVPAFRVKQDVVPGRFTQTWFRATRTGKFHLFCAEYCGTQHSGMIGTVTVLEPSEYEAWLAGGGTATPGQTLAQMGERLFNERACNTCHLPSGEGRGPSLVGLLGSTVKLEGGGTAIADETYVRESILDPAAKVVAGFQPLMPTFQGQLSEEQIVELLAYIRSLGPRQGGATAAAHGSEGNKP
jgi:cytochrome c oxidase subunit 2